MGRKPIPQRIRRRFDAAVDTLTAIMPPGWSLEVVRRSDTGGTVRATNTSGETGELNILVRKELDPRSAVALDDPERSTFVFARWLSKRTRMILSDCGFSYGDDTGNISLLLQAPEIYIRLDGARQDPSPKPTKGPNLRGPKAWALLRTLIEVLPPYTVGELANAVDTDPGYVSRVLTALSDELLITRPPRGEVQHVEWEALLRQLTSSYTLLDANETTNWIAPLGRTSSSPTSAPPNSNNGQSLAHSPRLVLSQSLHQRSLLCTRTIPNGSLTRFGFAKSEMVGTLS